MICMFVVALCCQAHAQIISEHTHDVAHHTGGHTIVRSCGNPYVVTYFVTTGLTPAMEVLDQSTGLTYYADLPTDVFILDMHIDPDTRTIYFCGSTSYYAYYPGSLLGEGIIGWIRLPDFFSSYITVNYIYLNDPAYPINSVNKLVEYDNRGLPQIVAIGEHRYRQGDYVYSEQYFVDCLDLTGNITLKVGLFPTNEHYYDVLLTDNYVVLMGSGINSGLSSICYRKTDPYNLNDPMLDDIHFFANGDDYLSTTHSTSMFDDEIATSYLALNKNGDFVTRVRVIDVNLDLNINSQDFLLDTKSEPIDIIHIPADNSLVIMQDFYTPIGSLNSNFVFIDPYANIPYATSLEYRPNEFFQSMTMHDLSYYLAAEDGATWFLKNKTLTPTDFPDQRCPKVEEFKIEPIDNLESHSIFYQFTTPPCRFTFNFLYNQVNPSYIDPDCLNY